MQMKCVQKVIQHSPTYIKYLRDSPKLVACFVR